MSGPGPDIPPQPTGRTALVVIDMQNSYFELPGLEKGDHVEVVKTRDSAFHRTDLRERLDRLQVAHLLLCGVSTHSCVAQTAMAAFAENLHVAIARDAVGSEDPDLSEALLVFLHQEMRQPILSQPESLALLRQGWPPR